MLSPDPAGVHTFSERSTYMRMPEVLIQALQAGSIPYKASRATSDTTCSGLKAEHPVGDHAPQQRLHNQVGHLHIALRQGVWHGGIHACCPLSVVHYALNRDDRLRGHSTDTQRHWPGTALPL